MSTRPVRPLSRKMADRLRKLAEGCSMLCKEDEGTLLIMAGSKTFGGKPVKGLVSEIHMLLRGHESAHPCKEI